MNKKTQITILLTFFAVLTAASTLTVYYTLSLPNEETTITTLCTYHHTGRYNYIAHLDPNIIYNKTTLAPGEGTLYTAIVDHIDLAFNYTFTSNLIVSTTTTNHQTTIELESTGWTKTLTTTEKQETLQFTNTLNFTLQIAKTQIQPLVDTIDTETGTRTTTYNIKITPIIHTTAETPASTIDETFTPTLTIAFKSDTTTGNYIDIQNLQQHKTGQIQDTQTNYLPWTKNLQYAAYIFLATTLSATAFTSFAYLKLKPTFPQKSPKPIEEIIQPYKDIIAQTTQLPSKTRQTTTITLTTLEDLAKIAETLIKPILHTQQVEKHVFYLIENNTTYQYTTTAPNKSTR